MIFDTLYNKGYEAGVTAQKLECQEDQNRRLEEMLKYGKQIGLSEGYTKGYHDGYTVGYSEGEQDTLAREGIVRVPEKVLAEVKEEFEAVEDDMEAV